MKTKVNSDNTTGTYVVVPEFSLITNPKQADKCTTEGFAFADARGRRILFDMRCFFHEMFPDGAVDSTDYADYVRGLMTARSALVAAEIPRNISVIFPGVIPEILSHKYFEQIVSIPGSFTLDLNNNYTSDLLQFFCKTETHTDKTINVICDRTISTDSIKTVCDLWKNGADLTLCYGRSAVNTLKNNRFEADIFDVSNGVLIIPGKTLTKCIPVEIQMDDNITYTQIKNHLLSFIKDEIAVRFSVSSKGKLYYNSDCKYDCLNPFGMYYRNCISKHEGKIRSIFSGGAEYDIIAFVLQGCSETILRYAAAACTALEGEYPIKAVPAYRDIQYAESLHEVRSIIEDHARISRNAYGGCILELIVSDSFDITNYSDIANIVSALFGSGGMMIKIRKEAY